jgi:anti-anti-sigma factor
MHIDVQPERQWVRLAPVGELDLATVPDLARVVDELRDVGFDAFKVDLQGLTFMDSTGLRYLLELSREEGVRLEITPGQGPAQRLFDLAGVVELLPLATAGRGR